MTKPKRRRARKALLWKPLAGPSPELVAPPAKARSSVEDPLLDWPDDEQQADQWLLSRVAGDVQRD